MSAALRQAIRTQFAPARGDAVLPPFPPQYTVAPVEAFFDRWPQCVHAKQPPQSACALGGPAVLGPWARGSKHFALRLPAGSSDGLVGPFQGVGGCLVPYFRPGDLTWIDPDVEPADADFVVVMWSDNFYQQIMRKAGEKFRRETGRYPGGLAAKRLQLVGSEWCMTTAGSRGATAALPLAGNARVLGVVRYVERGGKTTRALPAHMISLEVVTETDTLGPNAATQVYSAQDDGPDSFNPSAGGDGYLSLNGTGIDSASVLNGSLTIDAQIVDPSTTLAGIALQVTWSGGSESTPTAQPQHTDRRAYSFQHSFTTLPADTAWTMRVAMSGNANATVQRAALRAEVIKR